MHLRHDISPWIMGTEAGGKNRQQKQKEGQELYFVMESNLFLSPGFLCEKVQECQYHRVFPSASLISLVEASCKSWDPKLLCFYGIVCRKSCHFKSTRGKLLKQYLYQTKGDRGSEYAHTENGFLIRLMLIWCHLLYLLACRYLLRNWTN